MDLLKLAGMFGAAKPGEPSLFDRVEQFMAEWFKFMAHLRSELTMTNRRLDAIDSKLQTVIDGHPQTVTPEVLEQSIAAANADPRNSAEIIRHGVG